MDQLDAALRREAQHAGVQTCPAIPLFIAEDEHYIALS
jgi:hypothetical protein